jgi:hypothetical protein
VLIFKNATSPSYLRFITPRDAKTGLPGIIESVGQAVATQRTRTCITERPINMPL